MGQWLGRLLWEQDIVEVRVLSTLLKSSELCKAKVMMYTLHDRMETYHLLEYSSIGQSIRLIRGRLKVRVFLFQQYESPPRSRRENNVVRILYGDNVRINYGYSEMVSLRSPKPQLWVRILLPVQIGSLV